jgi:tetratricopeptide (TPR) repeat protein
LPVLTAALKLKSPLSRSSAAGGLLGFRSEEAKLALLHAATDEYRLVRLAAAQSLAAFPLDEFNAQQQEVFLKVNEEYEKSLVSRNDDWSSFYNLGIHYQNMGNFAEAVSAYMTSLKIYPEALLPLINCSYLYSVSGDQVNAEALLGKALVIDPLNEAANLNFGLLMAEMKKMGEAEKAFRTVLKVNASNATAAYNLSIIVSAHDVKESCKLSKQAMEASPEDPKFSYTYAYFLNQDNQKAEAIRQLEKTVKAFPGHLSSVFLLGSIYLDTGNKVKLIELYNRTMSLTGIGQQAREQLRSEVERVKTMR